MENVLSFLVIDDENIIVTSVEKIIAKAFPNSHIYKANDGLTGWDIIKEKSPSIVLSDITMPGLDGISLCKRVKTDSIAKETYFIIMTAHQNNEEQVSVLEEGVDDFIMKPFSQQEIIAKLKAAYRIVRLRSMLQNENERLKQASEQIERYYDEMISIISGILEARIPNFARRIPYIADAAVWIGKKLGEVSDEDLRTIELSANLCFIGRMILPDSLMNNEIMKDGAPSNPLLMQVPVTAQKILEKSQNTEAIAKIMRHIYENFDGSGFPDRVQSWQIPLISRIIRVVVDFYEDIDCNNMKPIESLIKIKNASTRLYDHRCVALLEQYITEHENSGENADIKPVQLQDLKEGMLVMKEVITNSGLKLMPAGIVLRENIIQKIITINSSDPILGNIYVKKT